MRRPLFWGRPPRTCNPIEAHLYVILSYHVIVLTALQLEVVREMGQSESNLQQCFQRTVDELSMLELGEIGNRFNELYATAGGPKGQLIDKKAFSDYFRLPEAIGDRLFDAFDKRKVSP